MLKHFTYDGLGRLVRVQSPWPDVEHANGGVRSERFYYDGARRIQEMVTDPVAIIELLQSPEGGSNNPELTELMSQTVPGEVLGSGDGSANPMSFESGQLEKPNTVIGIGGDPLPTSLGGMEREYIWGPGDNGLDEILVQYDIERKAFWMIQDAGGDVIAMCDLDSNGNARVVHTWQYDAYGQCIGANQLVDNTSTYTVPLNRCGHKGLFLDRLDVGLSYYNQSTLSIVDHPRLAPHSIVLYQNRNRTYSPQLGRFIQRDPNETGSSTLIAGGTHGIGLGAEVDAFNLEASYSDSANLHSYMKGSPWTGRDPSGLFTLPEQLINLALQMTEDAMDAYMGLQGDYVRAGLSLLVGGYSAGQEELFDKSDDWEVSDEEFEGLTAGGVSSGLAIDFSPTSNSAGGERATAGATSPTSIRYLNQLSNGLSQRGGFGQRLLDRMFRTGHTGALFRTGVAGTGRRFVDKAVKIGNITYLFEVKTGSAKLSRFIERQIMKDKWIMDNRPNHMPVWLFVPRGGPPPDPKLLARLTAEGIPYSIR